MSTLANAAAVTECSARIARLRPDSRARWGRMTVHQMVCHLNDSFRVATGEKYAKPASNVLTRTAVRWLALRVPLRWGHNFPTRPEIKQGVGGTPPGDWDRDVGELEERMSSFRDREQFGVHPIFGKMTRSDWLIWGYRHVDHHLRQFGV